MVIGYSTEGSIICTGYECANVLGTFLGAPYPEYVASISPENEVDHEAFCEALEDAKPAGCTLGSPPPTPVYGGGWAANGCGTAHWGFAVINAWIAVPFPVPNGTSLDNPALDVYFQNACNAHDACYGSGQVRADCDSDFANDLDDACSSSSNPLCNGYSATYSNIVDNYGDGPYAGAAANLVCAAWNNDMETSGCE